MRNLTQHGELWPTETSLRGPVIAWALTCIAVLAAPVHGETINVPGDFATIQAGINAAEDGDEVVVSTGVYFENINFVGKDITVRSVDPLDPSTVQFTIIDGRALNSVVTMDRGVISGFTIRNGRARSGDRDGGGVYLKYAPDQDGEISHNVITDCVAIQSGGGIASRWGGGNSTRLIRDNTLTNNSAWGGGGMNVVSTIVVNNVISSNEACCFGTGPAGGGIEAAGRSIIRDNLIIDNYSDELGGGIWAHGDVIVENNFIAGNEAFVVAGGVRTANDMIVRNNTIVGNAVTLAADGGGGIDAEMRTRVLGNTIVGNSAEDAGGNVLARHDSIVLGNIIAFSVLGEGFYTRGRATGDYNCVFGNAEGNYRVGQEPGEHDMNVDPLFIDLAGPDGIIGTDDDNLRLLPDSPCIDAGDPDHVPAEGETDLDGHARILCDRVDIGAYEFGIGDFDCDRIVDLFDFAEWQACMTGPKNPPDSPLGKGGRRGIADGCEAFDFDGDLDVDFADFGGFQASVLLP